MTASFQRQEPGFEHAAPMPADAPPPERVPSQAARFAEYGADARVPERVRRALAQRAALPFPLDLRLVDPVDNVRAGRGESGRCARALTCRNVHPRADLAAAAPRAAAGVDARAGAAGR